ncbi:hypothetical protein D7004_03535 [Pedobacter jejuensis]|uniref:Uncharacterized protein n=1 Tax=Pedobacter jejuensis TaxID=1268550 RepID=A0A3N0C0W7_9SPHI|nr:hypothetical protein D7004_03535 [Pedobacter jejuensis]
MKSALCFYMVKCYHIIYKCFASLVIWNTHQGKIDRAVYGLTYFIFFLFHTLLFLIGAQLNWKFNGYFLAIGSLICLCLLYKVNLKYFLNLDQKAVSFSSKKIEKWFRVLGCILFFGSIISMGFAGKNFSRKSKIRKLMDTRINLTPLK